MRKSVARRLFTAVTSSVLIISVLVATGGAASASRSMTSFNPNSLTAATRKQKPVAGKLKWPRYYADTPTANGGVGAVGGPAVRPKKMHVNLAATMHSLGVSSNPRTVKGNKHKFSTSSLPGPDMTFDGLAAQQWDDYYANLEGDVSPEYYVQTSSGSIGIFDKTSGAMLGYDQLTNFFDAANTNDACEPADETFFQNPDVLYDTQSDRWMVMLTAWQDPANGPYNQCIAVSTTGNPLDTNWNVYSIQIQPSGDVYVDGEAYGLWDDGLYLSENLECDDTCPVAYPAYSFIGIQIFGFNLADLESGSALRWQTTIGTGHAAGNTFDNTNFNGPTPATMRVQSGTPPAARPEYFVGNEFPWGTTTSNYNQDVWRWDVNWNVPASSTISNAQQVGEREANTGPTAYFEPRDEIDEPPPGNQLDTNYDSDLGRIQYTNIGGSENLWATHAVDSTDNVTAPAKTQVRWYKMGIDPSNSQLLVQGTGNQNYRSGNQTSATTTQGSSSPTNETQTITMVGGPTGGAFTVTFERPNGTFATSAAMSPTIAASSGGTNMQNVLRAVTNIGSPNVTVVRTGSGTAGSPFVYAVTFASALAGIDVNQMTTTVTTPLTGGTSPSISVATTQAGGVPQNVNEVQTVTLTNGPTAGTFQLSFENPTANVQTTGPLAFNASGADVLAALQGLSNVGAPQITSVVRSGAGTFASPYVYTITFGGSFAGTNVNQIAVINTGTLVGANQGATYAPDNTVDRWTPALAVDKLGDMAVAYSAINGRNNNPMVYESIRYSGRAVTDAGNTLQAPETNMWTGTGYQCCSDGDPILAQTQTTATVLDPNGCELWATNQYFDDSPTDVTDDQWIARVGAFHFSSCTPTLLATNLSASGTGNGPGGKLTATLKATGTNSGIGGKTINFTLGGPSVGSAITNNRGVATLTGVDFSSLSAGTNAGAVGVSYTGTPDVYSASANTGDALKSGGGAQTITFAPLPGKTFGDADFNVSASSDSLLPVSFSASGKCTVTGTLVHLTGAGSCTITASQAGDATYDPATDVPQTFAVAKATPTVTFTALANNNVGQTQDKTTNLSSSNGQPTVLTSTAQCSVRPLNGPNRWRITSLHVGVCTVTATSPATADYNAASAQQNITIGQGTQTATYSPGNSSRRVDQLTPATPYVTLNSGLTPSVTVTSPAVCSLSGSGGIQAITLGSCTVSVTQAGNADWLPLSTSHPLTINGGTNTITFNPNPLGTFAVGDPDFAVSASAASGGAVTFTTTAAASICTVTGTTVHIVGVGSCPVVANSAATGLFAAASAVTRTATIQASRLFPQTITFAAAQVPNMNFGDPNSAMTATASSGLAVTLASDTPSTCTVVGGNQLHAVSPGTCTIRASQPGDANYSAATDVTQTSTISKGFDSISMQTPDDMQMSDPAFDPGATTTSGLPVTYSTTTPSKCSVSGNLVSPVHVGTCFVVASESTGNANWNASPDVNRHFQITAGDQTIAFGGLGDKTVGDPDFDVSALATSGLAVTFTAAPGSICTVSPAATNHGTVHLTAASHGDCTITAHQAGNVDWNAAPNVPQTFHVKDNQTIAFSAIPDHQYGDSDFVVAPSATSGLAVTLSAAGDCTVAGSTVHITDVGSCTVTAHQGGDDNYNPAPNVDQAFDINPGDQTIAMDVIPDKTFGASDFQAHAVATSGLNITSFSAVGDCTVSPSTPNHTTVHIVQAGSCTVTAHQTGSSQWNAAPDASRSFTINAASQTIAFDPIPNKTFGDPDFDVSASATSGLDVTFTAAGDCHVTPAATNHATVSIDHGGSCTVTAHQDGDISHGAAAPVDQSFLIFKHNQTVSFGSLSNKTYGDPDFDISASSSSGLPVTFSAAGQCTVAPAATNHGTVSITAGGSCTITAHQAGDTDYHSAPDVDQSFTIAKANQSIAFASLPDKTWPVSDFGVSASATSGLTVTFTASGDCTVAGSTVHVLNAGSCTVTAHQSGNGNYNPASNVARSFTINKANQMITFPAIATPKNFGDADFPAGASSDSGLTVTYTTTGSCTVSGSTVHITNWNDCTVTAHQSGNVNFNAATDASSTFHVNRANITSLVLGAPASAPKNSVITLTGTATSPAGTVTGQVKFLVNGVKVVAHKLVGGVATATYKVPGPSGKTLKIQAKYKPRMQDPFNAAASTKHNLSVT